MKLMPEFRWGLANGWLFLVVYFLGLVSTVATFTREKRSKLFFEPKLKRASPGWFILSLGRFAAISFVILMVFSPLRIGTPFFVLGAVVYVVGYALVVLSLLDYKRAPLNRPITEGLYRLSRNPQWIGLVLVFLGTATAVAGWLQLVLLLVLVGGYHFQILAEEESCKRFYGEPYQAYMDQVPRYLLFF